MDLVSTVTGLQIEAVFADLKIVHRSRQKPVGEVLTFSGSNRAASDTEEISINTEDCGSVLIRFEGGAHGNLFVSQVTAGRKNCIRFEIAGSRSALSWNSESPNQLWLGNRERANEVLVRDPALLADNVRRFANYPGGHNEGFPDTFKQLFRAFYEYIAAEDNSVAPPYPTFQQGHMEVRLCAAVLESHRTEKWVHL
jgi:predicted dehydrogenase